MFDHFEKKQWNNCLMLISSKADIEEGMSIMMIDDALESLLEPRDKFRIKKCIPGMDALESNLERRASVYTMML